MPGHPIRVYPITAQEATSIEKTERIIRRAGYTSIALGTVACAAGGIMHYFGGQDLAKTANEVVESGLYALAVGGSISMLALLSGMLLSGRMISSRPEHPSMTGTIKGDLEKRIKRIDNKPRESSYPM